MPAKPLSKEQLEDAARLKSAFESAQKSDPSITQESVAMLCGWKTQGTVSQYLNGKIPLNLPALLRFCRALPIAPSDISPCLAKEYELPELKGPEDSDPNAEPAGRPRTMHPVKIKGFAKLGDNGYYEEIECDGWVDSYSPDPDAYGLRVKGDSMHPAIRNGSVVVIEPRGQLVPGEYVAIALTNGKKMVKELVFDRHDEIVVESVNGNRRMTIERKNIAQIQPVAAVVSPSKWRPE